jgi:hypothetical protein
MILDLPTESLTDMVFVKGTAPELPAGDIAGLNLRNVPLQVIFAEDESFKRFNIVLVKL